MKYEAIFKKVQPAIMSKREELQLNHVRTLTDRDIWDFCLTYVWKEGAVETLRIHNIIHDILTITPAQFITYREAERATVEREGYSSLNEAELELLLIEEEDGL